MNRNFWEEKRVMITGHTGFKGSWLSLWLLNAGAQVTGYSLPPPTEPSLFKVAGLDRRMTSTLADVRDIESVKAAISKYEPEVLIHMAAQSLVRPSYVLPVDTFETNIMGTVNVLEAIRHHGCVRAAVIVTSDKCYKNNECVWGYRENEPMGGHDPYSSSKGCAELVTAAYISSFFSDVNSTGRKVSVATVRAGNVIGGGDWASDRLIPDIMIAFLQKDQPIIRNPNAIRPWQFVLEPLGGYLMLAEKLWNHGNDFVGGWNFGPDDKDARPVSWIADQLANLWGDSVHWKSDDRQHPHEANYLKLDCSKAKHLLGWVPKVDLVTALTWTIDWFKAYATQQDMFSTTIEQIMRFERTAT